MLPNANDINYFIELYKVKNISRASERLGVSQPSLSIALKRLEDKLEVKLFNRSKTGAVPTKEADLIYKDIEDLANQWNLLRNKAKAASQELKGHLRIGVHPSVALHTTPLWLKTFLHKNTGIEFSFVHDLSRKITEQIISFKVDLGFVINPTKHPDLVLKKLFKDEVTFRSSKKLKKENHTIAIYDPSMNQSQTLIRNASKKGIDFKQHIHSSSLELIENMVSNGVGVGILPKRVCKSDYLTPFKGVKPFQDELYLAYRADIYKNKAFDELLEHIKENFQSININYNK